MEVGPDGRIILPETNVKEPAPMNTEGSAIDAAAKDVQQSVNTQVAAVDKLGGKIGGSRRKMRYRGGAEVEVKNIPQNMVSAGGTDPKNVFGDLMEVAAQAKAAGAYDGLGYAPPVSVGGKRSRKHKKRKHGSSRRSHHNTRKHRRTSRKYRGVRHTRRRVHSHK